MVKVLWTLEGIDRRSANEGFDKTITAAEMLPSTIDTGGSEGEAFSRSEFEGYDRTR